MNREELAWAAGFFDGEGHITFRDTSGVTVGVTQSYLPPLERFQRAVGGLGVIQTTGKRENRPAHHREILRWQVHDWREVQAVLAMLWPWLAAEPKRERARAALVRTARGGRLRSDGACGRGHPRSAAYHNGRQWVCRACARFRSANART